MGIKFRRIKKKDSKKIEKAPAAAGSPEAIAAKERYKQSPRKYNSNFRGKPYRPTVEPIDRYGLPSNKPRAAGGLLGRLLGNLTGNPAAGGAAAGQLSREELLASLVGDSSRQRPPKVTDMMRRPIMSGPGKVIQPSEPAPEGMRYEPIKSMQRGQEGKITGYRLVPINGTVKEANPLTARAAALEAAKKQPQQPEQDPLKQAEQQAQQPVKQTMPAQPTVISPAQQMQDMKSAMYQTEEKPPVDLAAEEAERKRKEEEERLRQQQMQASTGQGM